MSLRPYQEEGAAFLAGRARALLTDLPRLGKTAQALTAAARLGVTEMSVVGPASVRDVWPAERDTWAPGITLDVQSYDQAAKRGIPAAPVVVFDEWHRMKNPSAKRSRLLVHPSTRQAGHVWALSGTPTPNGPHELFTVCAAFWPTEVVQQLGVRNERDWWDTFTVYRISDYGRQYLRPKNSEMLANFLRNKQLGRKWSDVFDQLAPVMWTTQHLQADKDLSALADLCPGIDLMLALGKIPVNTSALRHAVGLEKCTPALRVIQDSLEDGEEKVVIVYHHQDVGDALQAGLMRYGAVRVDGGSSRENREASRSMFMELSGIRVFLGQLDAIREGIKLSVANVLHNVEPSWTPGYNEQVGMRIMDPTKTVPSTVVTHVLADSLDEDIMRVVARKEDGRHTL